MGSHPAAGRNPGRHFSLPQQCRDLPQAEPLLRLDQAPFQVNFYRFAWSQNAQSGQRGLVDYVGLEMALRSRSLDSLL